MKNVLLAPPPPSPPFSRNSNEIKFESCTYLYTSKYNGTYIHIRKPGQIESFFETFFFRGPYLVWKRLEIDRGALEMVHVDVCRNVFYR